jgi:hypothetical protein
MPNTNELKAHSPSWANADYSAIDVVLEHPIFGDVKFTATPDGDSYGNIFDRATSGEFGIIAQFIPPPPAPRMIPYEVSRFQGMAALSLCGYLSDVEEYFNSPNADDFSKLAWDNIQTFRRDSPMLTSLGSMLELTDEQIDDLFVFASTLYA